MNQPIKSQFAFAVVSVLLLSCGCNNGGSDSVEPPAAATTGSVETQPSSNGKAERQGSIATDSNTPSPDSNTPSPYSNKPNLKKAKSTKPDAAATDQVPAQPVSPAVNLAKFHAPLAAAADDYFRYGLVNTNALIAPAFCRDPSAIPMISQADAASVHGQKIYFLFAKEIADYINRSIVPPVAGEPVVPNPVGQTLVKESWAVAPANSNARNLRNHASGHRVTPRVEFNGQLVEISSRTELFIMTKLDPKTADTDDGWVYGVVDPDTKAIKAAGRVESCIACHESAPQDRLFGLAGLSVLMQSDAEEPATSEPTGRETRTGAED